MKFLFLVALTFAFNANAQKIDWFASADYVAVHNDQNSLEQDSYLREFELALHSKVDQDWSAALSFVYETEANSETHSEVHEAYLYSSTFIKGQQLKFGKFFLGLGRLARVHRHEWNFTSAPFFYETFFGSHGPIDLGVEYTHMIGTSQNLQLTLGVSKGSEFNHDHSHEEESSEPTNAQWPTHYMRLGGFHEISSLSGLDYGLNYMVRKDAEKNTFYYAGSDFTYKRREGKVLSWFAQLEYWRRTFHAAGSQEDFDYGYYLNLQKGIDLHHSVGVLYSVYKGPEDVHAPGHSHEGRVVHDEYNSIEAYYTYANSEFMKTRFSFAKEDGLEIDHEEVENHKAQIQILFNIGKHPVHFF